MFASGQILNQDPTHRTFPLLRLPYYLRLCVYEQCTPLTLAKLACTCRQTRRDLHENPSIVQRSLGYIFIIDTTGTSPYSSAPSQSIRW
ncbi:hypothetical protein BJ508DRAFT_141272 [Ascobolus immersus RN42]|uniref:F-box domain-containing protein n=1 Tax=Ascobolus immersus RN42 TaxID=1160509 RepID=A0A3N4I1W9_ASCIM|nr:hypothetical protein BJ508DRAFT_141272 [Ascobolus immersus RN42]